MSIPMQPYIIGAISDAIQTRVGHIAKQAAEAVPGDLHQQMAFRALLVDKDYGNLASDRERIEQACHLVKTTYSEWWRTGRRSVQQGDFDTSADATQYLRLDHFRQISISPVEVFELEGAFVSSQERDGQRDWTLTVLFSGDRQRDLRAMSLNELTKHQASVVISTWNADQPRPETAFYGRREIAYHPATLAAIDELWRELASLIKCDASSFEQTGNQPLQLPHF